MVGYWICGHWSGKFKKAFGRKILLVWSLMNGVRERVISSSGAVSMHKVFGSLRSKINISVALNDTNILPLKYGHAHGNTKLTAEALEYTCTKSLICNNILKNSRSKQWPCATYKMNVHPVTLYL